MEPTNEYVAAVRARLATGVAQEHAHRDALQTLLKRLRPDVTPVNEPSRVACGAPDIAVTRTGVAIGYAECKDIDADLRKAEKSEQLRRYREALPNLILTDYLQFRWYVEGKLRADARLGHLADERTLRTTHEGMESVLGLLREFLQHETPEIGTARELAERMAGLARMIRHATLEVLTAEVGVNGGTGGPPVSAVDSGTPGSGVSEVEDNSATAAHARAGRATEDHARAAHATLAPAGPLHAQLQAFREVLVPGLSEDDFADMYAQTIAYGLFAARCNHRGPEAFTRQAAAWDLPKTNPFLQKLFNEIAGPSLDARIAWIVDDLARLLAVASMDSVMQDFTSRTGREDPVVHFYETFLREYDPKLREVRGVYYTPEPVVSYIVRSVDHILKTEFDLPDGLADERVFILDPACGTGTFLFFVIRHIHEFVVAKYGKGAWPGYVRDKLLRRLFGFELLMAPYTIAHMKLAMQLRELGYDFPDDQRLGIYLTNTLEEAAQRSDVLFAQYIADEANAASRIKRDEPIMVVIGNPPYSNFGRLNKGPWIMGLLEDYKRGLHEKKLNLDDDYIKFIRFAQWRIERTGYGVLGYITNNSYLDGLTHRRMRETLLSTFGALRLCNLHGDVRRGETTADGRPDRNVFDIQQGVAVALFTKSRRTSREVAYADLLGEREAKYAWLHQHDAASAPTDALAPREPWFFLVPKDFALEPEYQSCALLKSLFPLTTTAVQTNRDPLTVADTVDQARGLLARLTDRSVSDHAIEAGLELEPVRHWSLRDARAQLSASGVDGIPILPYAYRPFDNRQIIYDPRLVHRQRAELRDHMAGRDNLCLLASRGTLLTQTGPCLCSRVLPDKRLLAGSTGEAKVFPLYVYTSSDTLPAGHELRRPNLDPKFIADLEARLGLRFVPEGRGDLGLGGGVNGGTRGSRVSAVEDNAFAAAHGRAAHATEDHARAGRATEWPDWRAPVRVRQGAYLPHWTRDGGTYAVSFRLHDSLPQHVLDEWRAERDEIIRQAAGSDRALSPALEQRLAELQSERIEAYLDAGHGACYLRDPRVAEMVQRALLHFAGERYELIAWCLMPNHVHLVLRPLPGHELDEIMQSRKSYTAHAANRLLGRTGSFWQTEYYDHLIRDEGEFEHAIDYVLRNPAKAGLEEWPWCGVNGGTPASRGTCGSHVGEVEDNASTASHARAAHATEDHARAARATMEGTFGPEDVFDYIYAVLHSPTYRERYAEFLKIDFPRIPLTSDLGLFRRLCAAGRELVALHLMEHPMLDESPAKLEPAGTNEVEAVAYDDKAHRVHINKQQYFAPVEPEVYAFQVGGYEVLNKWLKDRKGRTLTFEDVRHYGKVVVALRETRRLMAEIDEAIPAWPME
ncbi:MAG: hypothetical protein FJX75_12090 [Armatimonadetes bacterium]|nr:hypothetical protein [Armatimonadota bacterium]